MEEMQNPYAAPGAPLPSVPPPLPATGQADLAGRGERLLARIIDQLLYAACFLPFLALILLRDGSRHGGFVSLALLMVLAALLGLFVYNLSLLSESGQTVGKRWLGIRIVRTDGSDADLGRVFGLRMCVPWLIGFFLGPLFVLPDVLFIFGNERRCLHDMMADTIVVDA
ncbi:RDD family protein [Lysobacter sp. Root494]|uniref:RDD family protein n=1 Tax=Lysobacter sp. Root494 TaxID=1736549 RepID=UPI000700D3B6|nr:RDD family protein [Lysobacter sp. Root494]KQY54767.1 hypothetical protein ASD14_00850 [Lysobacter sp. Root494]